MLQGTVFTLDPSHLSLGTFALHESAGDDRRICRVRPNPKTCPPPSAGPHCVDRKLDFLIRELKRFDVTIASIQETKWFGQDVWTVDGCTLLHPGHNLPGDGELFLRNEGVGIVLDQRATAT